MIDQEKWKEMNEEQKLQMCKSVNEGVNVNAVTKGDWKIMFEFLLNKVCGSR